LPSPVLSQKNQEKQKNNNQNDLINALFTTQPTMNRKLIFIFEQKLIKYTFTFSQLYVTQSLKNSNFLFI
jgi:hypothetical protein